LNDIIYGDFRADNIFFAGPGSEVIEAVIVREAPLIDPTFELEGKQYPIFRSHEPLSISNWKLILPFDPLLQPFF